MQEPAKANLTPLPLSIRWRGGQGERLKIWDGAKITADMTDFWVLGLPQDLHDHIAVDVGQAPIDAIMAEGQFLVVDAELMQNGGVQIIAISGVNRGLIR